MSVDPTANPGGASPIALRLARAYGGPMPNAVAKVSGSSDRVAPGSPSRPITAQSEPRVASPSLRALIAAFVPGGVDFSGTEPMPQGATRPFYRHPADRNAAAVQIDLGRRVDVTG